MDKKSNQPTAKAVVGTLGKKGAKRKAVDIHSEVDTSNMVSGKRQRK
jgi:hypothetical protein